MKAVQKYPIGTFVILKEDWPSQFVRIYTADGKSRREPWPSTIIFAAGVRAQVVECVRSDGSFDYKLDSGTTAAAWVGESILSAAP